MQGGDREPRAFSGLSLGCLGRVIWLSSSADKTVTVSVGLIHQRAKSVRGLVPVVDW